MTDFLVKSIVATFGACVLCVYLPSMVMTAMDTQADVSGTTVVELYNLPGNQK